MLAFYQDWPQNQCSCMVFFVDLLELRLCWAPYFTVLSICWSRYDVFSTLLESGGYVHLAITKTRFILIVKFICDNHVWSHKGYCLTILCVIVVHFHFYHCLPIAVFILVTKAHSKTLHFTVRWHWLVLFLSSHISHREVTKGRSISLMIWSDGNLNFRSSWGCLVDNRIVVHHRSLHRFIFSVNLTLILLTQISQIYVRKVRLRFRQFGHSYVVIPWWLLPSAACIRCLIILTLLDLKVIVRSEYVAQNWIFHVV